MPEVGGVRTATGAWLITAGLLAGNIWPAQAFVHSNLPGMETQTEFDGRFIDNVSRQAWTPPLERQQAQRATRSSTQLRSLGDDSGDYGVRGDDQARPPGRDDDRLPIVRDGVLLFRMSADGLLPENRLYGYLQGLVARLLVNSPRQGVPSRVLILAGRNYQEADTTPDGVIGVPLAFLEAAQSEDEIAALLAHELSHVILEHHDLDWYNQLQSNMVNSAIFAATMLAKLAQQTGAGGNFLADTTKYVMMAQLSSRALDEGFFPSLTREQEDEADLLGLDLMMAAGFNYQGMFDFLGNLQDIEEQLAAQAAEQAARKKAATGAAASADMAQGNVGGAVNAVLGELGDAVSEIFGRAAKKHRSAEARLDSLFDYLDREYRDQPEFEEPEASRAFALARDKKIKAIFADYRSLSDAALALRQADLDKAKSETDKVWKGPRRNHDWALFTRSQLWGAAGNRKNQQINLNKALKSPFAPLEVYRSLSRSYLEAGQTAKGVAVAVEAWEIFQKPPQFYPEIIQAYRLAGNNGEVRTLSLACQLEYRDQARLCQAAARGQPIRP
jgi:predicted Zn-dependent protease|tara:strand:+ start:17684 stop:19357 length:1674 start_codon:yes stop_codon:yes gene_type:complete